MGYYTRYELKVVPSTEQDAIANAIESKCGYDVFDDSTKWYECDETTKEVSQEHPGVLISISGRGEESLDVWRKDYLNGEVVSEWRCPEDVPPIPEETLIKAQAAWNETMDDPKRRRMAELKDAIAKAQEELKTLGS